MVNIVFTINEAVCHQELFQADLLDTKLSWIIKTLNYIRFVVVFARVFLYIEGSVPFYRFTPALHLKKKSIRTLVVLVIRWYVKCLSGDLISTLILHQIQLLLMTELIV